MKGKWVFHKRVAPWWRVWVLLGLVGAAGYLVSTTGAGAQDNSFSETSSLPDIDPFTALLTRRGPSAVRLSSRAPQLYRTTQGERSFTFQVNGQNGLIRFHCAPDDSTLECDLLDGLPFEEIHLLQATRSPRGDVIYKDQDGHAVLRVTATGGATLYGSEHMVTAAQASAFLDPVAGGKAVLPVVGQADMLMPQVITDEMVRERMRRASELMAIRHALLLTFMSSTPIDDDRTVLADTILTTAKAIDMVAGDELGARVIGERLQTVAIEPGPDAGLDFNDSVLTITYNRSQGILGRPSSVTISRFLEGVL